MSCSPFDLRDYFLKELSAPERQQVDLHLKTCAACRDEVQRLRLTEAALASLRDEEVPRRLAFVSDKIFEPSPWQRAWTRFWNSGARLGFASAAMLSIALVVFSSNRAAAVREREAALTPQVQHEIQAAVDRAVAASEARTEQRIARLASYADAALDYNRRQELLLERSSYYGGRQ
ncbi:MAG TPA: zf-HC2 domain-containing protein [Bryobacteraceae bacterium]|nr:zf-HC2 domain-containing protein [Bryobacteraceae bacterium]